MLIRKKILAIISLAVMPSLLCAHGKNDIEKKQAENFDSWQETFDLTGKKKGKYNIMITATDFGGNRVVEGPYNIYIDPKSDLPVCGVIHPAPNMRIVGNLNIIGTCIDDDGVAFVNIILDNDEDNPIRADGKEFWSYFLDTSALEDGIHSIKVIGTDINGLEGRPVIVTWNLDRQGPTSEVQNYSMGTLVSGNAHFRGTITDGNGIASFSYSVDNGVTFTEAKIKLNKKDGNSTFEIPINTKLSPDGPAVIWFKAKDKTGSESIYSFLYFIDNSPPKVQITTPQEDEQQAGKFFIAGYAEDTVGLETLTWIFGKDSGEIEIIPGNPYWALEFDTGDTKEKLRKFTITARDKAGNVITMSRNIILNQAPKPVAIITEPTQSVSFDEADEVFVRGIATDSDGIQYVKYRLDNGEEQIQQTAGVFYAKLADVSALAGGKHTVTVIPTNIYGVEGTATSVEFETPGTAPVFGRLQFSSGKTEMDVTNGTAIVLAPKAQFFTTVTTQSGLSEVAWHFVFGNNIGETQYAKIRTEKSGEQMIVVPLPADIPEGVTQLHIIATDMQGRTTEQHTVFSIINDEEDATNSIEENIVYVMPDNNVKYDERAGAYVMTPGQSLIYYANVATPITASLAASADGLAVMTQGNIVTLTATTEGTYRSIILNIHDGEGALHYSPSVNIVSTSGAPELHLESPALHEWVKDFIKVTGTDVDKSGIKSIEYSSDGGHTWQPIPLSAQTATGVSFSYDISLANMTDGLVRLDIRACNNANRYAYMHTAVQKDTMPPDVRMVLPLESDVVNGNTLVAFIAKDSAGIRNVYYIAPHNANETAKKIELKAAPLITTYVGTQEQPMGDTMSFEFYDAAGNMTKLDSWNFSFDTESDLPRVEIHLPEENAIITRDFSISGVAYDDDGASTIWYKLDNGSFIQLPEPGTSFSIDVPLSVMTDNEHTITVYAVDANGVKGHEVSRTFRISLKEPEAAVITPTIDMSVRNSIEIRGTAKDANGIAKVQISLDNGNSYSDAIGTDEWTYTVDTRAIPDGTQLVFVKVTDKYGITGLYSTSLTIDNSSPVLLLELPLDDSTTAGNLFFSGYSYDNVAITNMYITVRSLEQKPVGESFKHIAIEPDKIIAEVVDISSLENGFYNIEVTSEDKAGNIARVSRNIELDKAKALTSVDLLYPLDGEHKQGRFKIYGQAAAENPITALTLYIDDISMGTTEITPMGFFSFDVTPDMVSKGTHTYRVAASVEGDIAVSSRTQSIVYSPTGPWITIDNFTYGDFAVDRPYIRGSAGYAIDEAELHFANTKEATKAQKQAIANKKVAYVELSFDNGKTFTRISKNEKWHYRIENKDIPEGYHFLLVRATMKNGETAVTRTIIQIDNTKPSIRLIAPSNGGRYNQALEFIGITSDEYGLTDVTLSLRKGDKASYEVPSFIQGLYFDFHFWGATLFDIGIGLSFFNDNVKLQFQWGQFTQSQRNTFSKTEMRYGGTNVFGVKILANVAHIPFGYFFGHNWDWLSANIALGADFSWFSQTSSGKPQILSALLTQLEFPRITIERLKYFSTYSLYTEGSLWFIPTDVTSNVKIKNIIPQIAAGIRINVF